MRTSRRSTPRAPGLALVAGLVLATAGHAAEEPARPRLAGTWTINRALSTPAGSVPMPDAPPGDAPDMDQIGRGVYGRRGAFGAGGRGPGDRRRGDEDMAARRGLIEELMATPASITITQDGDRLSVIEPDGIARIYYANDRTEKHQRLNGTIETRSRWDDGALVMELQPRGGPKITRRYASRPGTPAQLEITTRVDGDRKGARRVAVYDLADGSELPAAPTAADQDSRSR